MFQQAKSPATMTDSQSSTPGLHTVEREKWLPSAVLWSLHTYSYTQDILQRYNWLSWMIPLMVLTTDIGPFGPHIFPLRVFLISLLLLLHLCPNCYITLGVEFFSCQESRRGVLKWGRGVRKKGRVLPSNLCLAQRSGLASPSWNRMMSFMMPGLLRNMPM